MTKPKRHNIHDVLTKEGRNKINVGEVLTFEKEGERQQYRVVRKTKREVIVEETRLYTEQELENMAGDGQAK